VYPITNRLPIGLHAKRALFARKTPAGISVRIHTCIPCELAQGTQVLRVFKEKESTTLAFATAIATIEALE
jgi:hypothetical protein